MCALFRITPVCMPLSFGRWSTAKDAGGVQMHTLTSQTQCQQAVLHALHYEVQLLKAGNTTALPTCCAPAIATAVDLERPRTKTRGALERVVTCCTPATRIAVCDVCGYVKMRMHLIVTGLFKRARDRNTANANLRESRRKTAYYGS